MPSSRINDPVFAPWEVLDVRELLNAQPWFSVSVEKVRLPDGRVIGDYHQLRLPHYVVIVACTGEGQVMLLHQYKHGFRQACLTLPGGIVEEGERPEASARRELLEESGHEADRWTSLGSFVPHSNYGCGMAHLFLARNLRRVAEPASGDLEEARIVFVSKEDLVDSIREGKIVSLSSVAALGLAGLLNVQHLDGEAGGGGAAQGDPS